MTEHAQIKKADFIREWRLAFMYGFICGIALTAAIWFFA